MIRFGTSGWRGVMGAEFTFRNVRVVVQAIANYLLEAHGDGPVSVVGYHATTLQPVTFLSDVASEAFDRIRIIDGIAYLPKTFIRYP